MPQLNPNPWLFIMITSWFMFSLIFQPKTLSFTSTNPLINKTLTTTKNLPWIWPWS
uniref:ATP synthase complex subunit 8 n=1 Tax=Diopsittaca nobilis TaxID=178888 RepID=A0A7G9ITE6_9PSIT|nr:ATP synthase F0 subunit 8 [Diopsittaca nobilis]QNM38640.1 ATP synthase F0 subunit 8 [Diopsittaca nobilis]